MEPVWSQKELEMDLDLPETSYYGSEELMLQVWTDLLSNAVKFTPDHGTISVRIRVKTTGLAGGLHSPYKGIFPACARKAH